eukprot:7147640-Pyramimonas_sp.AAC.1
MARDGRLRHSGLTALQNRSVDPIVRFQTSAGQEFTVFNSGQLHLSMSLLDHARRAPHVRATHARVDPQVTMAASDDPAHHRLVSVRVRPELYQLPSSIER